MLIKQAIQTPWKVTYTVAVSPFTLDTQQHSPEAEIEISNISSSGVTILDQAGATIDVIPVSTSKVYTLQGGFFVPIASRTLGTGTGGGVTDHGLLTGLSDDDHPQYLNNTRGDARYSLLSHLHDDRYYTETEVDTLLSGKANTSHTHTVANITDLATNYYNKTQVDTSLSAKADLVGGVIPMSQIPAIAISDFLGSVASQSAMLALSGQKGDWCVRTDENKTYIITTGTGSVLGDWQVVSTPTAPVTSVNSQTGAVVLGKTDVGLGNVDNTSDVNKPVSTAMQTALNLKADDNTVAHLTSIETLTNKTITSPKINEVLDNNGVKVFSFTTTASAVNYIDIKNNATTFSPTLLAMGTDTDISINVVPKGTGNLLVNGVKVPTTVSTDILSNKSITRRVITTSNPASITTDIAVTDDHFVTSLGQALTINAPTGTPTDGQHFIIRIKDNGTARTIAWNSIFRAIGVTLPTTTVANKTVYIGLKYNATDTKWDVIAVAQEA